MRDVLLLRLDAPLMSFGGPLVDKHGRTAEFPGLSMLAGLCANALGYDHRDADQTQQLQDRLVYAARCDRAGARLDDFQTVDLSQEFLREGWTTRGKPMRRGGGDAARTGTHIRLREFIADAVYTVALALGSEETEPTPSSLAAALRRPARPLFIGRKPCLPAAPILLDLVRAETLLDALRMAEPLAADRTSDRASLTAWWPASENQAGIETVVVDERDWLNQTVGGQRLMLMGMVSLERVV